MTDAERRPVSAPPVSRLPESARERDERLAALAPAVEQAAANMPDDVAAIVFQAGEARRSGVDQMMWEVPALSLTGQSFLLTISLSAGNSPAARLMASLLGLIAGAATIQLLLKHRFNEETQSRWLEALARAKGWPQLHHPDTAEALAFRGSHHWRQVPAFRDLFERRLEARTQRASGAAVSRFRTGWTWVGARVEHLLKRLRRWLVSYRSPHVWILTLAVFVLVNAVVLLIAVGDGAVFD